MDPNAALTGLREWSLTGKHAEQARDLFQALDGWLSMGGFKPDDWEFAGKEYTNPDPYRTDGVPPRQAYDYEGQGVWRRRTADRRPYDLTDGSKGTGEDAP